MTTDSFSSSTAPRKFSAQNLLVGLLLALVLLLGGYFRLVGLNWDDFSFWHPDERFTTLQVLPAVGGGLAFTGPDALREQQICSERYPNSGGVGGYFDTQCSPWNPNNVGIGRYVYGTLPLYIANFFDDTWRWLALGSDGLPNVVSSANGMPADDPFPGLVYDGGHIAWRFASALFDIGTIVLTFLIGMRLHNKWVGLLAALLYACAPLPIQKAHFGTVNAITAFFAALAVLFAISVQKRGGIWHYLLFGLAFAAALAGRINIAPLFGLIIAAAALRIVPAFDWRIEREERSEILTQHVLGVILAAFVAVIGFRIFNPYAFIGPGFFGFGINPRWIADLQASSFDVSGYQDSAPNWQWVGRTPYLFPLGHMVLWGMGLAFGLAAWLSWLWVGWQIVCSRLRSTTNMLLFGWVLVYFAWLGGIWVVPMRYFLPLYPALAVLAAWGVWELGRRARAALPQPINEAIETTRRRSPLRLGLAWALLLFVAGFTVLWGLMFTNIYRNQLTRVQAAHWLWEQVPGDFAMRIEGAPDGTPLMNVAIPNRTYNGESNDPSLVASLLDTGRPYYYDVTAAAEGTVSAVLAPHLGDPDDDPDTESVRVMITDVESGALLAQGVITDNFLRDEHILGSAYTIPLDTPLPVQRGVTYRFSAEVIAGGPVLVGGSVVAQEGSWDDPISGTNTCERPLTVTVASSPPPGQISGRDCRGRLAYLALVVDYQMYIAFPEDVALKRDAIVDGLDYSDYITISSNRFYDTLPRNPERFAMTTRYYQALFSGELGYELVAVFDESFEFGPLQVSDQYLPIYNAPPWLNEFEADESFHVYDHPAVFIFRRTPDFSLDNAARIIDSVPLNTVADTLPFPCPEDPGEQYCSTGIIGVVSLPSIQFDQAPTFLQQPPDIWQPNTTGGTWSARFDINSLINTQPVLLVLVWWLTIVLFGWLVFPLLFGLLPKLADRGFGLAKMAGLLLTGWLLWSIASARLPFWSQQGIALAALLIGALSLLMAWTQRRALRDYLRANRRSLLVMEAVTLGAFLFFLAVRLSNPDLWHPFLGGEKPMDFAYFNGVLRSSVFPPIDPWYAGGYINYYYFGYVIVGVPTLLLGVVPSVAYNLIVPTLFALTGMGAFSVAFNAMSAWQERKATMLAADDHEAPAVQRPGHPWVAGIAALLLAVLLGNLDTPRVFLGEGLTATGFYQNPAGLANYYAAEFSRSTGQPPDPATLADINTRAAADAQDLWGSMWRGFQRLLNGEALSLPTNRWYWAPTRVIDDGTPETRDNEITELPYFTFLYGDLHAHMIAMPLMFMAMAFVLCEVLRAGERFTLLRVLALAFGALVVGILRATNTWDWPTFLLLAGAGLAYAWWLRWRGELKRREFFYLVLAGVILLFIPAILGAASFLQASQLTPTESSLPRIIILLLLAGAGLLALFWLGITRRSLLYLLLYLGGFFILQTLAALPYTTWYASSYNSAQEWTGGRTPLWAYLTIHGLFLFLIYALLLWETARWLRAVPVGALRGAGLWIVLGLVGVLAACGGTLLLTLRGYGAALLSVPALLWMAALFFRPGQTRAMQFLLALAGLALGLTLGVEFVVLTGDIGRQNTIFKFYLQAWLLFSVVGGVAFAVLLQHSDRWGAGLRTVWLTFIALLVTVAAMYPIMATRARAIDRMGTITPLTLDGMDYMQYSLHTEIISPNEVSSFALIDDYNIIRWLQQNVLGSPVIMEAVSVREYLWGSRIAIYTGLPSVVGWRWHQVQQRTFDPMPRLVDQRHANVNAFYTTSSIVDAWRILQYYNVEYVIVGGLERARYIVRDQFGNMLYNGLAKFDTMVSMGLLEIAYQEGDATIYRVNRGAELSLQAANDAG